MSAPSQSGTAWIDGTNASATLGAERGLDEEQQKTESNASGGVFNLCNTRVEVLIRSRRNRIQGKPGYRVAGLKRRCRRVPASPGVGSDLPISPNCSGSYVVACALCLPLYLCEVAPGPFYRRVFPGKYMGFFSGGLCLGSMGRRRDRLGCHCALRMPRGSVGSFVATGMERHLSTAEVGRYYEGFSNGVL